MKKKLRIAILSRGPGLYSTRSLYTAARNRGHRVWITDHMKCNLLVNSGKNDILYYNNRFMPVDAIIPRIGASVTDHGAALIRQFEENGIYTLLSSEALVLARNKFSCLQKLAANGIGVPTTLLPATSDMAWHMLDKIKGPPYIIKLAKGTHGVGVLKAASKGDAARLLDTFQQLKGMVMIQEYIAESSGKDIRIIVVGNEIVASMERSSSGGDFRSNLHLGGTSRKIDITEEEAATAIQSAQLMGLEVAGVDLLRSNRGPLVLEVNASPGLEGIEKTTEVDISGRIISHLEKVLEKGKSEEKE